MPGVLINSEMFKNLLFLNCKTLRSTQRFFAKKNDYYQTLGVNKTATQAEIKKAFAKLARELHPDKNASPEAKDKFSKVTEAYQTLSDEKKRQVYDQYGMTGDEQKQYQNSGFDPNDAGFGFSDFFGNQQSGNPYENIFRDFGDMFGFDSTSKPIRPQRGADIILSVELEFLEAVNGTTKEVSFRIKDTCSTCQGSKCKPGTSPVKCTTCSGRGTVTYSQGPMQIQMSCNSCKGAGSTIKTPCQNCRGTGVANITIKETINVPRGINNGQNLRITAKGNKGENGGAHGDLIIKVSVKPDIYFKREGSDIYTDVSISISQAVLGAKIDVRTLSGSRSVTVPAGTSHGSKIRLPGEGISKLAPNHNQKGDHYVVFNVYIPSKLNSEQKKIFEQLRSVEEQKSSAPASKYTTTEPKINEPSSPSNGNTQEKKQDEGFFKAFEHIWNKSNN